MPEPLLINAKKAAQLCDVSTSYWYRLEKSKRIPKAIKIGIGRGRKVWSVEKLKLWIRLNCPIQRILESETKKICKLEGKKRIEAIADSYVKEILCKGKDLQHKDIPKDLVELKREIIKINRLIKGMKNEQGKKDCKRHYKRT